MSNFVEILIALLLIVFLSLCTGIPNIPCMGCLARYPCSSENKIILENITGRMINIGETANITFQLSVSCVNNSAFSNQSILAYVKGDSEVQRLIYNISYNLTTKFFGSFKPDRAGMYYITLVDTVYYKDNQYVMDDVTEVLEVITPHQASTLKTAEGVEQELNQTNQQLNVTNQNLQTINQTVSNISNQINTISGRVDNLSNQINQSEYKSSIKDFLKTLIEILVSVFTVYLAIKWKTIKQKKTSKILLIIIIVLLLALGYLSFF